MKSNKLTLIKCIAVPLIVGGISAFLTRGGMTIFAALKQPPLSAGLGVPCGVDGALHTDGHCLLSCAHFRRRRTGNSRRHCALQLPAYGKFSLAGIFL